MSKVVPWFSLVMLLLGCQATANRKSEEPGKHSVPPAPPFKQEAIHLTEDNTELVLAKAHVGPDRSVALVIRYSERPVKGGHCILSIIEQTAAGAVVIESSDQVMSCSGMSVPTAEAVKGGLEAKVESDFIRLDEDRIRNRSEYEFVRASDGRWHLTYSADIGPEEDPATGELLVASYGVAYRTVLEGPLVSEVDRETVKRAREKSVY